MAYLEPRQTSEIGRFAKIGNGSKLLTILAKRTILDFRQGSQNTSESQVLT